jgi:hypothetical protein
MLAVIRTCPQNYLPRPCRLRVWAGVPWRLW